MNSDERHESTLRILEMRERTSVAELTERLGVSEVTVRKDLAVLEERGLLVRTRGGARLAQDRSRVLPVARRQTSRRRVKHALGMRAAELVRDGETVFIDSGTSCREVARALVGKDVRVVTSSLDALAELTGEEMPVICIGGSLRHDARSFIGPIAVESLRRFHFDRAILGATGLSFTGVLSSQNSFESEVKRTAIEQAARVVVVADSSKIGSDAFSIFAEPTDVQILVIDDCERSRELEDAVPFEVLRINTRRSRHESS